MTDLIEQIKADREAGTAGPWTPLNMVHDAGRPMTPDEIGEYVKGSVLLGEKDRFLFVSAKHSDGGDCDVCHTGNGPKGPANTKRIARVPEMEQALIDQAAEIERLRAALDEIRCGRGMFGVDASKDLEWAMSHSNAALEPSE